MPITCSWWDRAVCRSTRHLATFDRRRAQDPPPGFRLRSFSDWFAISVGMARAVTVSRRYSATIRLSTNATSTSSNMKETRYAIPTAERMAAIDARDLQRGGAELADAGRGAGVACHEEISTGLRPSSLRPLRPSGATPDYACRRRACCSSGDRKR